MRLNLLATACLFALPGLSVAGGGASAQWKAYALSSMTPDFEWVAAQPEQSTNQRGVSRDSLLRSATKEALIGWREKGDLKLTFSENSFGSSLYSDNSGLGLLDNARSAMAGMQTNTSLRQSLNSESDVALTAIIARNRFSTPGMGSSPWQSVEQFTGVRQNGVQEISEGGGVQLSLNQQMADRLTLSVALQSRLDMDPFKSYRGIYSEAGDFDLPGFARTGVEWAVSDRFALGADVQRVMYSGVDTFTAASLPTRFLALLGDGSSPEFAWQDLTVYSVEAAMLDDAGGRWSLRYSTQQQPRTTSAVLSSALSEQYSDLNVGFGYQRYFSPFSHFQLSASYAPAGYFMTSAPFLQSDFDGGSQVEVEAQWTLAF